LYPSENIKILVTDSGLGGLSVFADIFKKLTLKSPYSKVQLVFVDALFDANSGYNKLKTNQEKVDIFNQALLGFEKRFAPDIIFIACNTLSVLYEETAFSKKTKTEVVGIVEDGVDIIFKQMSKDENSQVIIFATETTINSENHKKALIAKGINKSRIFTKACPNLQSLIEKNPHGVETKDLIDKYVTEILTEIPETSDLYISLNCTHYGYAQQLWQEVFASKNIQLKGILDPNNQMANRLFFNKNNIISNPDIDIKVVSKVKMHPENQNAMIQLFKNEVPALAKAISDYDYLPYLF
jgi:glutamate racemase